MRRRPPTRPVWFIAAESADAAVPDPMRVRHVLGELLRRHGMRCLEVTDGHPSAMARIAKLADGVPQSVPSAIRNHCSATNSAGCSVPVTGNEGRDAA